jgi:hypothetical protein
MSDLLSLSIFGELIPAANLPPTVSLTMVKNQAGGGDGKSTTIVTAIGGNLAKDVADRRFR